MAEFGGGGPIPILGGSNHHNADKRTGVSGLVAFIHHLDSEGMYEPELKEEVMVPHPQIPNQLVPATRMAVGRDNMVSAVDLVEMVWKRIHEEVRKLVRESTQEQYLRGHSDGMADGLAQAQQDAMDAAKPQIESPLSGSD